MPTTVDNLSVKWGADFRELLAEYKKGEAASAQFRQKISKEMDGARKAFEALGAGLKGLLVGALSALSVGRIAKLATDTLEWADNLKSAADRLGISTDALQELQFAGRAVNITVAEMTKGIESFWAKFSEAAVGRGRGADILTAMGIDVRKINNAEQALAAFSDKIKQFDRQSQLAAAKAFFGDENAGKFLELLLSNMGEARQSARALGAVIDSDLISKGEALNKEFEKVTDILQSKVRREVLQLTVDFQTLVGLIGTLGPEFDKFAESLARSSFLAPLFLIRDQQAAARAEAAKIRAAELFSEDAAAAANGPPTGGRRRLPARGSESAMEGFEKQIQKLRNEALALQHELRFDKATAANVKALEDFANAAGKFKPTAEQVKQFSRALKDVEAGKTALAFKDIADQNERLAQIVAAEVSGNRELVAILEQRFALEDRLGRQLTEAELARADALAKTRFEMEQLRERQRALMQDLEGLFDSFQGHAGQALDSILDKSKTVGEAMRDFWASVLRDIANEMFKLAAINPLKNLLFGQNNPTLSSVGGLFGSLFGGGGNILGGAGATNIFGDLSAGLPLTFAEGGRPPLNMPSIVGERGPELFVPDVPGTIMPNGRFGGGTAVLYGRPDSTVRLAEVEAQLKRLGFRVNMIDQGIEGRAVAANADARRRYDG